MHSIKGKDRENIQDGGRDKMNRKVVVLSASHNGIYYENTQKTKHFILQIETCIRTMEQLNIPMNLSKFFGQKCYLMSFSVFMLLYIIIKDARKLLSYGMDYWKTFIMIYLYRFPLIILIFNDFTFIFWMSFIKLELSQLNKLLKSMLTTTIDSPQHKRVLLRGNIRKNEPVLDDIREKYKSKEDVKRIKKASFNINHYYVLQCVLFLIIYERYTTNRTKLFLSLLDFFLCHEDHFNILCELYEPSTSNEIRMKIRDFTLQFIQNPLILTSCGIFDLNYTLIRNVIGTVATYIVILIQIGNLSQQDLNNNSTLSPNND
ncbi:uncharacterized protein LOC118442088 [Vespa mandarinia]|uniref:uncharacterized protein LOC118442088 n=1 Tax=Vespa mandarinia TaxID=7446 RepID=UPI0016196DB2|nr:uncharacterized protein LOC118442088 [Vespa mandarinia]